MPAESPNNFKIRGMIVECDSTVKCNSHKDYMEKVIFINLFFLVFTLNHMLSNTGILLTVRWSKFLK